MPDLSPKRLKNDARLALLSVKNGNHKRIVFLYSIIVLGLSFINSLAYFIIDLLIQNTAGGLSGLDTTGTLKGIASIIDLLSTLATPFLTMSLMHCAIGFARQDPMEPKSLKEGFYRWGVFLRLILCQGIMYILMFYLAVVAASTLYFMLPNAGSTLLQVEPIVTQFQSTGTVTDAQALLLVQTMWPMLVIMVVLYLIVMLPLSYGYRMSFYRIMDNNPPRARRAIAQSRAMMKGRKWKLFRLDLSFWWYYLLQGLVSAVMIIVAEQLYGVIPGADLLCSIVLCSFLFLIYRIYLAYVETTYALFYDRILQLYLPQYPTGAPEQYQTPVQFISQPDDTNE